MINYMFIGESLHCGGIYPILMVLKRALTIIQILGPILAIVSLMISLFKMVSKSDLGEMDKIKKRIKNSLIALVMLFFIPLFINIVMYLVGNNTVLTECWNNLDSNGKVSPSNGGSGNTQRGGNVIRVIDDGPYPEGSDNVNPNGSENENDSSNRAVLATNGVSGNQANYVGDDHYQLKIGEITYEVYGQNESGFSQTNLRDGRTFSNGGCGPTTLASALSSFGYKGSPVEVNQAGSDVSAESHAKAIEKLKADGKLSKNVKVITHSKSSLPNNASAFYDEVRTALRKGHVVVMDIREGSKQGQNYCNIYPEGDYYDNEGAVHAHWVTIAAYDPNNDLAFFANSCGSRKWYSLKTIMNLTYEAVSGKVFNDESGWVGTWVEIYE